CRESPKLTMTPIFSPPAPDGKYFDVALDSSTSMLQAGTVAGTITLQAQAQLDGKDIKLRNASSVTLEVPSEPGVIRSVSIENRTASSFQITVTGFSTPRETGDNAKTEVCLTFLAANGASIEPNTQFCYLQKDIQIWYERSASYPTGSQFQAK